MAYDGHQNGGFTIVGSGINCLSLFRIQVSDIEIPFVLRGYWRFPCSHAGRMYPPKAREERRRTWWY